MFHELLSIETEYVDSCRYFLIQFVINFVFCMCTPAFEFPQAAIQHTLI